MTVPHNKSIVLISLIYIYNNKEVWTDFTRQQVHTLIRVSFFFLQLLVLDDDVAEEETTRLTDGTQAALEAGAEELLSAAAVDHEDAQAGRDLPDVLESDGGKLAAPAQR